MASGGDSFYECSICFNDLISSKPKLLQCGHSFCLECLQRLVKDEKITCPTCKQPTAVPGGKAQALTSNFQLIHMYEAMVAQMKKMNVEICCQMCMKEEGVNKCQTCPSRMCAACTQKHAKFPQFRGHVVLPLCPIHDKGISHICVECGTSVCPSCIMADHENHAEKIVEYEQGISALKEKVKKWRERVVQGKSSLETSEAETRTRMQINDEIKEIMKRRYEKSAEKTADLWRQYEESSEETALIKTLLDKAENDRDKNRRTSLECLGNVKIRYDCILAYTQELENEKDEDFVKNFDSKLQKLEQQFTSVHEGIKVEYELSPLVHMDAECEEVMRRFTGKGDKKLTEKRKEKWLSDPKLVLYLTNQSNANLQLKYLAQIVYDNKLLFVCNDKPGQVLQLDEQGNILRKYIPEGQSVTVSGMALHKTFLYMNTEEEIIRMPLDGGEQRVYRPGIRKMQKMLIVSDDKFIITVITDGQPTFGRIYEYNPKRNTSRVCVSGLKWPSYITKIYIKDELRYLVTLETAGQVKVYDKEWHEVATIGGWGSIDGQLLFTRATAVTESGTVLVADLPNCRICEFTLEGTFIRHVLTQLHGIRQPTGLAYCRPNLWITEWDPPSVKCFRIAA